MIDRRSLLALAAVSPMTATAVRAAVAGDPTEVIGLWPGLPPGAPSPLPQEQYVERAAVGQPRDRYAAHVARPTITVFRPEHPNGNGVLIAPGGGYVRVVTDKEGFETARWLNSRGTTAFVLRYRLPGDGWQHRADVPLQDAQRAMRLIRAHAASLGVGPERIGVMGFSAGGHVAATLAVRHAATVYAPIDAADRISARPAVAALLYPVISMGPSAHVGSRDELLGRAPGQDQIAAYSPDRAVDASTPPTILVHAADDPAVPVENSLSMFAALRRASVPAELHIFEHGGHGFGLRLAPDAPAMRWPELVAAFAGAHGLKS